MARTQVQEYVPNLEVTLLTTPLRRPLGWLFLQNPGKTAPCPLSSPRITQNHTAIKTFAITTFEGFEEILAAELTALGASDVEPGRRVVMCKGDQALMYRANLNLRTGIRVLTELATFRARNEQEMYDQLKAIDWSPYLKVDGFLWIDANTQSEYHRNAVYLSQLSKDAIVDQFRAKTGERPSVSKEDADMTLNLHVTRDDQVSVSLNSSGDSLHRRGYRKRTGGAPINEVLAAGLLTLAGYDGEVPFCDPMCGSGTIIAEAAMIAAHQAPGLNRSFGFERWPDFDPALWASIRQEARNKVRTPPHPILANDIDELTLRLAKISLERTDQVSHIEFQSIPFDQLLAPTPLEGEQGGILVTNPPYEVRLKTGNIEELYEMMGDTFKTNWKGYSAWLITGSPEGLKSVGLKTSRRIPLMNGPIEVRFAKYELYAGTRKFKEEEE
ncbi:MAG: putative N6-adenine-specific DNA methylase [Neolewinella sp.]|jgi:putative N6-adenine-specific DNA methylase